MSFLDDVKATVRQHMCATGLLLQQLEKSDPALCDEVEHAISLPVTEAGSTAIARVLTERGHKIGRESIRRHRSRECACP